MVSISTFRDIIALWPSPGEMAVAIGAARATGRKWAQRDNIPSEWWSLILATSIAREAGLTAEMLAGLAARTSKAADLVEGRACP